MHNLQRHRERANVGFFFSACSSLLLRCQHDVSLMYGERMESWFARPKNGASCPSVLVKIQAVAEASVEGGEGEDGTKALRIGGVPGLLVVLHWRTLGAPASRILMARSALHAKRQQLYLNQCH